MEGNGAVALSLCFGHSWIITVKWKQDQILRRYDQQQQQQQQQHQQSVYWESGHAFAISLDIYVQGVFFNWPSPVGW